MLMTLPPFVGAELYFPSFLISQDEDAVADLSYFTPAGAQLPGNYDVELYLNGTWLAERKLKFVPVDSLTSSHAALLSGGMFMTILAWWRV